MLNLFRLKVMCRSITSLPITKSTAVLGNDNINPFIYNRNPRNMERLRIARKPRGYYIETKGRTFWNKLKIYSTGRHLIGEVVHNSGSIAVSASTKEWAVRQHLYRTNDLSAYVNLARVLAQRCLESGIAEVYFDKTPELNTKQFSFIETLEKGGVSLDEPLEYYHAKPSDKFKQEKAWEVHE